MTERDELKQQMEELSKKRDDLKEICKKALQEKKQNI
jgi:hypothetical protein